MGVSGAVVLTVLVVALLYTGAAAPRELSDPGTFTRWALPLSKGIHNIALSAVIGSLIFAVGILPLHLTWSGNRRKGQHDDGVEHPAFTRTMTLAAGAAVLWTLSALAVMVLTYSDVAGIPLSGDPSYTEGLLAFLTDFDTGRAWLSESIIAAVVATLTFGVRNLTGLALTTILAFGGLVPLSLIGHAAGGDDHYGAVNSIALHLLGVTAWVGGIIVLAVISPKLSAGAVQPLTGAGSPRATDRDITAVVLQRFSTLAGLAFVLVFFSGVINASIRMADPTQLATEWGTLVLIKAAGTILLGVIGYMHRKWIIPQLDVRKTAKAVLWQLITVELVIMAAVSGVAVALARTAPPVPEELQPDATPARILTGYDLPPELTPLRWLTVWRWDWLWVAFAVIVAVAYVLGMLKVRRRGDRWPVLRAISWMVGLAALTYVTSGAPTVYGMVLFSAHMVGHMALTMVVPLFLVLGAPVTLALKALTPRQDGTRGIREWILIGVHSRFSKLITHPLFAAANFAGSIIIFYFSPLFGLALRYHVGHELMNLHFLLTGYLFVLTMIGSDPVPKRAPYPLRLLLLFATMAFHAFFGVTLMGGTSLLQASWFGNMGRDWGPSALVDQQLGGAVTWGIGEIPTLAVALGVAVVWSRSDARERKRVDRAAERTHDAELDAYNNMFAKLQEQDRKRGM